MNPRIYPVCDAGDPTSVVTECEHRVYRIIRFRFDRPSRTVRSHLTLAEAQAWCARPDTSSHSTGPGAFFDGYDYMRGFKPTRAA